MMVGEMTVLMASAAAAVIGLIAGISRLNHPLMLVMHAGPSVLARTAERRSHTLGRGRAYATV